MSKNGQRTLGEKTQELIDIGKKEGKIIKLLYIGREEAVEIVETGRRIYVDEEGLEQIKVKVKIHS